MQVLHSSLTIVTLDKPIYLSEPLFSSLLKFNSSRVTMLYVICNTNLSRGIWTHFKTTMNGNFSHVQGIFLIGALSTVL